MLHLDVWWRGENVLVDPGSYLYNGAPEWHEHFTRTASHNAVTVDGRDQMLHHRRFKNLYWTRAALLGFEGGEGWRVVEGEHYGFARHPGRCVHRRAVLLAGDDLWVVVDRVAGRGRHAARLHWLAGPWPHRYDRPEGRLALSTPGGEFCVSVVDEGGSPIVGDVVSGRDAPPRGWLSRYYGEKVDAPSLAVGLEGEAPIVAVSLLSAGPAAVKVWGGEWLASAAGVRARFRIVEGRFADVRVERA
jgi:asparagine synthase (glutamine-hydrolysing)